MGTTTTEAASSSSAAAMTAGAATVSPFYPPPRNNNFGKFATSTTNISNHRLVFLGEIHSMPPIIALQRQIQSEMLEIQQQKQAQAQQQKEEEEEEEEEEETAFSPTQPLVHVIIEHISFEEQDILHN